LFPFANFLQCSDPIEIPKASKESRKKGKSPDAVDFNVALQILGAPNFNKNHHKKKYRKFSPNQTINKFRQSTGTKGMQICFVNHPLFENLILP